MTFEFDNDSSVTLGNIAVDVTGLGSGSESIVANAIADAINSVPSYADGFGTIVAGIPATGVRAQATTGSATISFVQIDPVVTNAVGVNGSANFGTLVNAANPSPGVAINSGALALDGGVQGDYLSITVPPTLTGVETGDATAGAVYYFQAGADFTVSASSTLSQIASSLATIIKSRNAYDASLS